ncbi:MULTISPECIES: hypothetical protein [unclassified Endozoicomonas]|uniref:hypothetical protein n=1 Tax=unclassified Endozoicomonas TaxID=2644528 RepID=UPI002148F5A6|nr:MULTISPECIES: hypothetical protein [unclassified Endozoicomonas]
MKEKLMCLFLMFCSVTAIGAGFERKWFWTYRGAAETGDHIVVTFNLETNNVTINGESIFSSPPDLSQIENPFLFLFAMNWGVIFHLSQLLASNKIGSVIPFYINVNDPIFKHVAEGEDGKSLFYFDKKADITLKSGIRYKKIGFKSKNGSMICIYMEEINGSEYTIRAVFMTSDKKYKHSYRDFNFKKDFGDGGSGGAGLVSNMLTYDSEIYYKQRMKNNYLDKSLADPFNNYLDKKLADPFNKSLEYNNMLVKIMISCSLYWLSSVGR